uniref:Uncharacterized protein n=1 Tax=Salix viminalis TaxID=40686 RepID=A0A6N2LSM3_SALVM
MFDFARNRISQAAFVFCSLDPKTSLLARNLERNFISSAAAGLPGEIVLAMCWGLTLCLSSSPLFWDRSYFQT